MKNQSRVRWLWLALSAAVLGCKSAPSASDSEAAGAKPLALKHPVSHEGLDLEGNKCSYSTELSADGKGIKFTVVANGINSDWSISAPLPLKRGYKEEVSDPLNVDIKSYDGSSFKWENKDKTNFLTRSWFKMKIDPDLLSPVNYEFKVFIGPIPIPLPGTLKKCTFR